jgi:phage tail sheath protein FI
MADTTYNHGIRVFDAGQSPRPVELDNTTSIGMVFTAPDADADVFPLNTVVQCFSNDPATLAALGETGTGLDNFQAITDQGIVARIYAVRVAKSTSETPSTEVTETTANMIGSAAAFSGVYALLRCRNLFGEDPGILIAPGYTTSYVSRGVLSVPVTAPGSGYSTPPTVGFTGGGGTGATATAVLGTGADAGKVVAIQITNPGTGYTTAPTASLTGGGGTGATLGTVVVGAVANPLVGALEAVATKLKAIAVVDAGGATRAESLAWRAAWTDGARLYVTWPHIKVWSSVAQAVVTAPLAARVAALFVKRDKQKGGPYWSPSNQAIGGCLGTAVPISYYDGDTDHDANALNQQRIATVIENRILWGNETLAIDPLWRFVNVRRTRDAIERSIVRAFRWAMDQNLDKHLAVAVIQSLDQFLDELTGAGAILGGRAYWLPEQNSNAELRSGILRVEFDAEETPPLQDLQFGSRRNAAYFDVLATDILSALEQNQLTS